jgi:hypothetical protein
MLWKKTWKSKMLRLWRHKRTKHNTVKWSQIRQRTDLCMGSWLIIYGFTSRSRTFHLNMDTSSLPVKGRKIYRPMLCTWGLWAGTKLYCVTPTVAQSLGFSGLIRMTAQISRLLRHTMGCARSILTRIITGIRMREIEMDLWNLVIVSSWDLNSYPYFQASTEVLRY